MEIYVCLDLNGAQKNQLRAAAGQAELHFEKPGGGLKAARDAFQRCEVVFGNPPAEWIASSPALRWVQLESTGFGEYTGLDWAVLDARVIMTNLAGFFEEPVAESALAGLLALLRGVDRVVELKRERRWLGDDLRPALRTLKGANAVLFGFGSINRRFAEMLAPFQCCVVSFGKDWRAKDLDCALGAADIAAVAAPDTPETRGVFSRGRIQHMKPGAIFLNFGRGSVVDEAALAGALEAGHLGGAVIDVTQDEPLPGDHRLWSCPNTILTQHSGGGAHDEIEGKIRVFASNLRRYRASERLTRVIDMKRGY